MLSGIRYGRNRKERKNEDPRLRSSAQGSARKSSLDEGNEDEEAGRRVRPPFELSGGGGTAEREPPSASADSQSEKAFNSEGRQEWMLGDFSSIFCGSRAQKRAELKKEEVERNIRVLSERELNPYVVHKGGGNVQVVPPGSVDTERGDETAGLSDVAVEGYMVGDGGRMWRQRAERRRRELERGGRTDPYEPRQKQGAFEQGSGATPMPAARTSAPYPATTSAQRWRKKSETAMGNEEKLLGAQSFRSRFSFIRPKRLETSETGSNDHGHCIAIGEDSRDDVASVKPSKGERTQLEVPHQRKSSEDFYNPPAIVSSNKKEEDANWLASQALKCLMANDEKGFLEFEERKKRALAAQAEEHSDARLPQSSTVVSRGASWKNQAGNSKIVRTLEDVDAQGRHIPLLEKLESNNRLHYARNWEESALETVPANNKRSRIRDSRDLEKNKVLPQASQDLYRETRVKGVQDFDKDYARYLMRQPKFNVNDEDDWLNFDQWEKQVSSRLQRRPAGGSDTRHQRIQDAKRLLLNQTENKCLFCPTSTRFHSARGDALIAESGNAYLCYQSYKQCVVQHHLFIAPKSHVASSPSLDENVYQEIRNFQKSLISCLDSHDIAFVFVEVLVRVPSMEKALMGGGSHLVIDCFGIPASRLKESQAYFKKALSETGGDWNTHKKVIHVAPSKEGPRRAVPKNFPYFYVDFSLAGGMLQVVEDDSYARDLGRGVIQGMMELDSVETHFKSRREYHDAVASFKRLFSPFDWTKGL